MKISIIIPVYNAEKYISRCIESVLAQTFTDWELILVDDGSKDSSLSICESFANTNSRIKIISQKNSGPSAARNKGLEIAKGEYICFIDADDWFDKELLKAYTDALTITKWDIIFQSFIRETIDGNELSTVFSTSMDTDAYTKEEIICKLYKEHVYGWSWCKMFRRYIIEKYKIRFDESLNLWEDELFTSQFLKYASSVKTIDCKHYHYVQYKQSLMNTNNTYLKRLALSEIMNEALLPISNNELLDYTNNTYNYNLKFSLLMALMNKPDHQCSKQYKLELLQKYYKRCESFPRLILHNSLKNRFSYFVSEFILMTRIPKFIFYMFSKI